MFCVGVFDFRFVKAPVSPLARIPGPGIGGKWSRGNPGVLAARDIRYNRGPWERRFMVPGRYAKQNGTLHDLQNRQLQIRAGEFIVPTVVSQQTQKLNF
jgi:hypothetical protein